jgi:hypothetical protein
MNREWMDYIESIRNLVNRPRDLELKKEIGKGKSLE